MKRRKTMTEINQTKWARMRLILDKLKEQPITLDEIECVVYEKASKIAKRTVQNYIAELIALGLVTYDSGKNLRIGWND